MRVGFPYFNDNQQDENKIYLLGNLDDKYYSLSIQDKSNLKYKYLRLDNKLECIIDISEVSGMRLVLMRFKLRMKVFPSQYNKTNYFVVSFQSNYMFNAIQRNHYFLK